MTRRSVWMAATWLGLTSSALAHKPAAFGEASYGSPKDAYEIEDAATSIVIYRTVTCERPELWMHVHADKDFPLFVQLLVPRIDRLADYRPSLAVVGAGLPTADVGIELPTGMGAVVFNSDDVATPKVFAEPFTQTEDWILIEETVTLPAAGEYYVVAWDPAHRTGKLDVAVGTVEQFGADDFANATEWTKKTRTFHETSDYPPPTPIVDTACGPDKEADAGDWSTSDAGGGLAPGGSCSVVATGAQHAERGWLTPLLALGFFFGRYGRRRLWVA